MLCFVVFYLFLGAHTTGESIEQQRLCQYGDVSVLSSAWNAQWIRCFHSVPAGFKDGLCGRRGSSKGRDLGVINGDFDGPDNSDQLVTLCWPDHAGGPQPWCEDSPSGGNSTCLTDQELHSLQSHHLHLPQQTTLMLNSVCIGIYLNK